MGKNNRKRRATKAKKRRDQARRHREHSGERHGGPPPAVAELIFAAVHAGDAQVFEKLISALLGLPYRAVASELQRLLELQVSWIWNGGWQPTDLIRVAAKKLGRDEVELLRCAIAAEAATYEQLGAAVAPAWMAQLEETGVVRWWAPSRPWPLQLGGAWSEVLAAGIRLLDLLGHLPEILRLVPPPSEWPTTPPPTGSSRHLPPRVLAKVRSLLAKAESTSFQAEAEALTAKAQELMTRHRIDRATLAGDRRVPAEEVIGRRIGIEDPYPEARVLLLGGIAGANGCRSVWSKDLGFATLFGHPDDIEGVERLFTSLLLQATAALRREGSKRDRFGTSRTRRFRRSFLVAFAGRVSDRLRETATETVQSVETETGAAIVPLLLARNRAVDRAVEEAFPAMRQFTLSATDWEGHWAGARLGDQVDLGEEAAETSETMALARVLGGGATSETA